MLDLSPAQIHLWQYALGEPPAPAHLAYAMTLLSDAEKAKQLIEVCCDASGPAHSP